MKRSTGLVGLLLVGACATGSTWKPPTQQDSGDVPEVLRPGYGNAELHTWWPLTPPEAAALRGLAEARQGDPHALLALAIAASGDQRDAASYAGHQQRVDQFLASVKPTIDGAADDWHRGYELHRAMHRTFFPGENAELGGYDFYQSRITGIFTGGHYNCLSSALLYTVLARGFGMPVRAAVVPTHVFVEMGTPGEKIIEVETTSATGFDWIHDARFYKEQAATWSSRRGLRPTTLEEYEHRKIVEPYRLMAEAMMNSHRGETDQDRSRLDELAGAVDPDDLETQQARIRAYTNEGHDLYEAKAWRTMARLFDTVRPAVVEVGAKSKDGKTLELVSWANWYHAHALMIVGRQEEAVALMADGIEHLDAGWKQADTLKANYISVLVNRLGELIDRKDYPTAAQTFGKHRTLCLSEGVCAGNASIVYANWSIDHQNAGDWQSARQVLQDCVSQMPGDSRCRDALADLESRHRF
jgi:hypothetical protein